MCYLAEMYRHLSTKPVRLTLMTNSQTTIDSLRSVQPIIDRMNHYLLDNVKKSVDREGNTHVTSSFQFKGEMLE